MDMTIDTNIPLSDTTPIETPQTDFRVRVSLETLLYAGIFIFAAFIRIVDLGVPLLNDAQAHEALAALRRVSSTVLGEPVVAHSPLMAFFNQMFFFFFGSGNNVARIATALAGTGLVMSPLLLRRVLGRITTLSMVGLLAVSPVAIISARTMGAVTWTMLLVFIGGWCLLRFVETQQKPYGLTVLLIGLTMFSLTEGTGLITLSGVIVGLMVAVLFVDNPTEENALGQRFKSISRTVADLPLGEGLLTGLALILIVGTGLFTAPGGLTSVGSVLYDFVDGLFNRPENVPFAYALLVAFRYETIILLLGVVMIYPALSEGTFGARFFAGWLLWSIFVALIYGNPEPSAALWLIIPATGLTASLISRMLHPVSSGFWVVPDWAMPLQAIVTLFLLIAIAINFNLIGRATQEEAHALGIERIESHVMSRAGKLGAITPEISETTMQLTIPEEIQAESVKITVQVVAITDGFEPEFWVTDSQGQTVFGPYAYADGRRGTVEELEFNRGTDYFFKFRQGGETIPTTDYQFMVITHNPKDRLLGVFLDIPTLTMLARITPSAPLSPAILIPFLLVLWIVLYLLFASLWGSRAAWRGLVFGLLLYAAGAGIGLGWQGSVTFANNSRELWYPATISTQYGDLAQTLEFLSLQQTGEPDKLSITVQGDDDTALAWLLRDFERIRFVAETGFETNTAVVIIPTDQPEPMLGNDYIGQDFVLSETWRVQDLSWTDMVAWLTVRQSRLDPVPHDHINLWVRKDVYGVDEIPEG